MSQIKICIAGATGRVGRKLAEAILNNNDLELVGAVSSSKQALGSIINRPDCRLTTETSIDEALKVPCSVLIDYTNPSIVKNNVMTAIAKGVHVVIGTSGLTDSDYAEIDKHAQSNKVGVLAGGNFSLTATLMQHLSTLAARHIPNWEIIEYGEATKPDAPSGTARETSKKLSEFFHPDLQSTPKHSSGMIEARGALLNGSHIHSVRSPGFYSGCEVIFGLDGERLIVRHESINDAAPYIFGTLLAVRKVHTFIGLRRGLDFILPLQ